MALPVFGGLMRMVAACDVGANSKPLFSRDALKKMKLFTARGLVRRVRSPPTCKVSGGDASRSLIEIGLSPAFRKLSARVMIETGPALRHLCRTISLCLADRFGMALEWLSSAVANPKRSASSCDVYRRRRRKAAPLLTRTRAPRFCGAFNG